MNQSTHDYIRMAVREQYGKVAKSKVSSGGSCATACCVEPSSNAKAAALELGYSNTELDQVPEGANMGLGCGNPKAIASLKTGETVLDLGSGGGFDCFLAAREVGELGRVIGVDMTPDMLSKARLNALKGDYHNVEFRLGEIENLPVADGIVDVIISNCVINLSPEKRKVFQEAYRVLKPGGRLAIADIVASVELPEHFKSDMQLLTGCVSGASSVEEIRTMLVAVGFESVSIKPRDATRPWIEKWIPDTGIEDYITSAIIEAIKPQA